MKCSVQMEPYIYRGDFMSCVYISSFGAKNDGIFDNTTIINKALEECAKENKTLIFGEGVYRTTSWKIPSNSKIILEKNAEISFIADFEAYSPVFSRWEGVNCYCMQPLLFIENAENVVIEGQGTFNGNGKKWWEYIIERRDTQKEPQLPVEKKFAQLNPGYENQPGGGGGRQCQFMRPAMLQILKSHNVTVKGVKIINSPFWTVHPVYSSHITFENLYVCNPGDSPNTDGIDIDSCHDVKVLHCTVDVGDDGICLKSGSGEDGVKTNIPTFNVYVEDCEVRNAHGGVVIGSETAAGIWNFEAKNCRFYGTDRGLRIKTRRGRGGDIHHIHFSDVYMEDTICPFVLNMYYGCGSDDAVLYSLEEQPVSKTTPRIADVYVENCKAVKSRGSAAFMVGLPERPLENIVIKNCQFDVDLACGGEWQVEMFKGIPHIKDKSIRLRNIQGVFENVTSNANPEILQETGVCVEFLKN